MSTPVGTFVTIAPGNEPAAPLNAPVIAADLHGLAVVYATLASSGSPATNKPVLNLAFSNDLVKFALASWLYLTIWDWTTDTGPPPPDLVVGSGIAGLWLTWDALEICCGRGYLSISAKATVGSPPAPSAFQQMYVGVLQWNSVEGAVGGVVLVLALIVKDVLGPLVKNLVKKMHSAELGANGETHLSVKDEKRFLAVELNLTTLTAQVVAFDEVLKRMAGTLETKVDTVVERLTEIRDEQHQQNELVGERVARNEQDIGHILKTIERMLDRGPGGGGARWSGGT
jgi:hypothetical protein